MLLHKVVHLNLSGYLIQGTLKKMYLSDNKRVSKI